MVYFSRVTPLNFLVAFFAGGRLLHAMNSPEVLLRLVHAVAPPMSDCPKDSIPNSGEARKTIYEQTSAEAPIS